MDVSYINPFIASTREVFDTMVKIPFTVGKPRVRDPDERLHKLYKFAVVVGLSGPISGLFVLNLSEPVALSLVGALTETSPTRMDADGMDALAEIANMIAGGAKRRLDTGQINMTVPTLLRTSDVFYPQNSPILVLPFDAPTGRFILEVVMRNRA